MSENIEVKGDRLMHIFDRWDEFVRQRHYRVCPSYSIYSDSLTNLPLRTSKMPVPEITDEEFFSD